MAKNAGPGSHYWRRISHVTKRFERNHNIWDAICLEHEIGCAALRGEGFIPVLEGRPWHQLLVT